MKKYHKSVLGVLWTMLNPLLTMLVLVMVFSLLFSRSVPNFPLYLITGKLLFNFNSDATTVAMHSITKNSGIIRKIYIPKYMFCISDLSVSFINLLFAFVPLFGVVLYTKAPITWLWLLIPGVLCLQLMFTLGLALILAAYSVFYRDLVHLYGIFSTLWWYLTPIFYPMEIIDPKYLFLWELNPMVHYITLFRSLVYSSVIPPARSMIIGLIYSVLMLLLGSIIFNEKQDKFFLYI